MILINDFTKNQEKALAAFKRKQKKEYKEYLQSLLDNLKEQKIKKLFFDFIAKFSKENSNFDKINDIKGIKLCNIERFIQDAIKKDYYLNIFRNMYHHLSNENKVNIQNLLFVNQSFDDYIFIERKDFLSIFELLDIKYIYSCLKDHSEFFECDKIQSFIFPDKNNTLYLKLFEQRKIDNF